MADDINTALRALANRWAIKARDYASAAKAEGATEAQASFNRGYAEGYYKAATELAALLKERESAKPVSSAAPADRPPAASSAGASQQRPAPRPAAPAAPPAPAYLSISVGEALSILEFAGLSARDVTQNKDGSFHAIFSRWENMMPHDRLDRMQKADGRIIILNSGKLESHDHFVDFAFKDN